MTTATSLADSTGSSRRSVCRPGVAATIVKPTTATASGIVTASAATRSAAVPRAGRRVDGDVDSGAEGGQAGEHGQVPVAPDERPVEAVDVRLVVAAEVAPPHRRRRSPARAAATTSTSISRPTASIASRTATVDDRITSPRTMIVNRPKRSARCPGWNCCPGVARSATTSARPSRRGRARRTGTTASARSSGSARRRNHRIWRTVTPAA